MKSAAILPGLACLAAAACTAGPDYARPAAPVGQALEQGRFLRSGDASSVAPVARWWEGLGDPVLSGLVEKALRDAPPVDAALARIAQARAGVRAGRAALLPAISASATYAYAELPGEAFGTAGGTEFYSLGFDTSWEADLWGGRRREIEAALARAGEADALLADAQVSLSAEIARSYIALRGREASAALLAERVEVEGKLARTAQLRLEGGTGTRQQTLAARALLAGTGAELAGVKAEIAVLRDALAVLTGDAPGALDGIGQAPVPLPPPEVAVGDPAALLARRPDVRAAERRLAAASAGIGVAEAARWPRLSLLGLLGIGGSGIGDVVDTSQLSAIALPRLTWNALDFGRAAAQVDAASAARDVALADYRGAQMAALLDTENALARFGAARIAFAGAGQAAANTKEAAGLEERRAQAGTISAADALEARRSAINASLAAANSRASLVAAYVAVAKALGLGWQDGADGLR